MKPFQLQLKITARLNRNPLNLLAVLSLFFLQTNIAVLAADEVPVYKIEVVNTWPHDATAFTQGLTWYQGNLYEGTGRNGQSSLRMVDLETGELLKRQNLAQRFFGEGIAIVDDRVYQLTWQSHYGFCL